MNSSRRCHVVPGTPGPFLVDGFRLQSCFPNTKSFFLSHFHGDHYTGLRPDFSQGLIYCSPMTRKLCMKVLGIDPARIVSIELGCRTAVEGVFVTLFDANHCPGAVMFQFETGNSGAITVLHTGDFRFDEKMLDYKFKRPIDTVYLDTTYSKPKFAFLSQQEAISMGVSVVKGTLPGVDCEPESTLYLVGAYNIGKEKLLLEIGKVLGKICVEARKMTGQLSCIFPDRLEREAIFTIDEVESNVHVCNMSFCGEMWPFFRPNFDNMNRYLDRTNSKSGKSYDKIVGIIPTGWASTSKWNRANSISTKDRCSVVLIPYSEHSSFDELQQFVKGIRARHIEPTVFASDSDRLSIMSRFRNLTDRTAGKRRFLEMMSSSSKGRSSTKGKKELSSMRSTLCSSTPSNTSSSSCDVLISSSVSALSSSSSSSSSPEISVIDLTNNLSGNIDSVSKKARPLSKKSGTLHKYFS